MNVFSYLLARSSVAPSPDRSPRKFVVEDNVGEAIHIHYRNLRQEFTVEDFRRYAEEMSDALEELENGNR